MYNLYMHKCEKFYVNLKPQYVSTHVRIYINKIFTICYISYTLYWCWQDST